MFSFFYLVWTSTTSRDHYHFLTFFWVFDSEPLYGDQRAPIHLSFAPADSILKLRHWRKYSPTYIKYGFIAVEHGGESQPQCIICMKTLANSAMKPSLLKRHLDSNHSNNKDRSESYFQRLGENVKRQRLDKTGSIYQRQTGVSKHRMKSLSW